MSLRFETLAAELLAGHPDTGAYDANIHTAANQLNAVNRTRNKAFLPGAEIFNNTDDAEFAALTTAQKNAWVQLCQIDEVNTQSGIAKNLEASTFGPGTTTRQNLVDLRSEDISRAEELGIGFIQPGEVEYARTM